MAWLFFSINLFVSSAAFSCSVCGFGEDPARWAFIFTTVILTFVPLIAIGGVVYYAWSRGKREADAKR